MPRSTAALNSEKPADRTRTLPTLEQILVTAFRVGPPASGLANLRSRRAAASLARLSRRRWVIPARGPPLQTRAARAPGPPSLLRVPGPVGPGYSSQRAPVAPGPGPPG
jgi:hypothetical protein